MRAAKLIRIATRESQLALWQAHYVKSGLEKVHPGLQVELIGMTSRGDQMLDAPLAQAGGKGLFVKELETALLEHAADIAVHSMKDVPMEFPLGLGLGAVCERADPRDALVSNRFGSVDALPRGSVVGTSSLRRQCQLRAVRPDLQIKSLRGNVNTRLSRLDDGQYDAIILASAGLLRLGMGERIGQPLPVAEFLPAGGQGAVGIELREDDQETRDLIAPLADEATAVCVAAERAMNRRLQAGCQAPTAVFAEFDGGDPDLVYLRGLVGRPDGREILRAESRAHVDCVEELGVEIADSLLRQGGRAILDEIRG